MSLVSAIVPTRNRPELVLRAARSVLAQTHLDLEAIVVVDGPDEESLQRLRALGDPRLRLLALPVSRGAAEARNAGVGHAKGDFVAFLDDDDQWLPEKLARQLEAAPKVGPALVTCLTCVRRPSTSSVQPRRTFEARGGTVDDYLFDRPTPFSPAGFLQTSSFFLPRATAGAFPFRAGSPHEDWDLVLRLSKAAGTPIRTVPKVLVVQHLDHGGPALSAAGGWALSLDWIKEMRPLLSPRAYAGLCLAVAGGRAARCGDLGGVAETVRESFKGAPRLWRMARLLLAAAWGAPRLRRAG